MAVTLTMMYILIKIKNYKKIIVTILIGGIQLDTHVVSHRD